ncbi:flavodoxin domain-containing protein [Rhodobacter calidifons]|uniref:Protoporphyrinogen oxidase n=1 Tax=Rhodobacter calidifons TaxID=2715277 RepID=A0ABX0G7A2_9RHOB|nr:flavodoxin domain-containing protein [Rhodobacter calidifons]NHB76755.1 protoporphyrinogen oxidase [Rhodobacter calidifons]
MYLLIAYATTDGQTRKIARFAADRMAGQGQAVELLNVEDAEGLDLSRFDAAILAGSLHAGGFQKALARFCASARTELAQMPTLFLAVSLSAAGQDPDDWSGLHKCLAAFQADTGWTPGEVEHVAGAFRFSEYDFFRAWAMRRIADQKGEKVEPGKDKEYTDWAALGRRLDAWLAGLSSRVTAGAASAS